MKLSPSHENSYESSRYVLLESTETKRLETWDNGYCVHYLVDGKWHTESFYFFQDAEVFYDAR
jgi:hypothetical protein